MKAGEASGVQFEGASNIEELKILGDWAYARAQLEVKTIPLKGGEPIYRSGYSLSILQKGRDGKWRIARDANPLTVKS